MKITENLVWIILLLSMTTCGVYEQYSKAKIKTEMYKAGLCEVNSKEFPYNVVTVKCQPIVIHEGTGVTQESK